MQRNSGPWTLQEAIRLLENVCNATQSKPILKQSIKLVYADQPDSSANRLKVDEDAGLITVYQPNKVTIGEVLPLLLKPNRAQKHFSDRSLEISWSAIQENLPTRSVDDIRTFWSLKLLPLLTNNRQQGHHLWSESDDLTLLQGIADQEINEADEPIDFSSGAIGNKRTTEENRQRWSILLKGLCSIGPGRRFKPSQTAEEMVNNIKTQKDRYVPYNPSASNGHRTGMQKYINIHDYFKERFQ